MDVRELWESICRSYGMEPMVPDHYKGMRALRARDDSQLIVRLWNSGGFENSYPIWTAELHVALSNPGRLAFWLGPGYSGSWKFQYMPLRDVVRGVQSLALDIQGEHFEALTTDVAGSEDLFRAWLSAGPCPPGSWYVVFSDAGRGRLPSGVSVLRLRYMVDKNEDIALGDCIALCDAFLEAHLDALAPADPCERAAWVRTHVEPVDVDTVPMWLGRKMRRHAFERLPDEVWAKRPDLLLEATTDSDSRLALNAALHLVRLGHELAVPALIRCLSSRVEGSEDVYDLALSALTERDESLADALHGALRGDGKDEQLLAGHRHRDAIIAALSRMVADGEDDLMGYAAKTLAAMQAEEALPVLEARAERESTLHALGRRLNPATDPHDLLQAAIRGLKGETDLPRPASPPTDGLPQPSSPDEPATERLPAPAAGADAGDRPSKG